MAYKKKWTEVLTKKCPYCKQKFETYVQVKVFCCQKHTRDYNNLVRQAKPYTLFQQNPWRRKLYKEYHGMELTEEEQQADWYDYPV